MGTGNGRVLGAGGQLPGERRALAPQRARRGADCLGSGAALLHGAHVPAAGQIRIAQTVSSSPSGLSSCRTTLAVLMQDDLANQSLATAVIAGGFFWATGSGGALEGGPVLAQGRAHDQVRADLQQQRVGRDGRARLREADRAHIPLHLQIGCREPSEGAQ